jgi:hypothetical protein
VPELRGDQLLKKWMLGSGGDGNLAAVGQRYHAERIVEALGCSYVSRNYGDAADIELLRMQSEHHGQGVVGSGIGVEDNFFRGSGSGCGQHDGEKQQKQEMRDSRRASLKVFQNVFLSQ